MRIAYHLGVHCTDDDRLVRTLHKNAAALAAEGIEVPHPNRYRALIRDTAIQLKGQAATQETQAIVLDQIMEAEVAERLILSWENFLAFPAWAVRGALYRTGGERMRAITQIFPEIEAEFHLGLRNPATYLPELHRRQRGRDYNEFIEGTDPALLRWSDLILSLRERNPDVPVFVWADEDTPLIWPEVLQSVSGHSEALELEDSADLLATLMTADGMRRMVAYMDSHPPQTIPQRRRIVSAFLDKFARPEQVDMQFALPGWTDDLVAQMTEQYERDMAYIATLPGVTYLEP
ncbi:hypothetical protein Q9299_08305 [Gemmobacter fulvus]|uniref:hypothetical protein n=1 Tax=Gemmobacter fulvus TaxID=2840474 RepID=UPI00279670BD|nr:hypothetical protein [Gemmobacter fulvus]MDQ1848288.1 hypothetical protein [Gemmobacter fulvus]